MDIALTLTVFLGIVFYVSSRESYFVVLVCSFSVCSSSFFVPNGHRPNTERLASLRALRQFTWVLFFNFIVLVCSFSVRFPRFSFQMDFALTLTVLIVFVLYVSWHESCFVVLVCSFSIRSSFVFNTRESYFVVLDLVCSFSVRSSLVFNTRESYFVVLDLECSFSVHSSLVFNSRESYFVVLHLVCSFSVRCSLVFRSKWTSPEHCFHTHRACSTSIHVSPVLLS